MKNRALVILSGGQDSTTCLHWAIKEFGKENIETITFDYGQKHKIELESAKKIAELAGLGFDLVNIPDVLRGSSPLTDLDAKLEKHENVSEFQAGIQETFVPARNILFLSIAANIALSKNCNKLVAGFCEADFGGYYDCRNDFIRAMETALNQGLFGHDGPKVQKLESKENLVSKGGLEILTPLMFLNKKESVQLAKELGEECLSALAYSHTCYDGAFPPCRECHACHLRARGFLEAGVNDPLGMRVSKELSLSK